MSTIVHADKILGCHDTDKKIGIAQDFICTNRHSDGPSNFGSVVRYNMKKEPVWARQILRTSPGANRAYIGDQCVLTRDKNYLYVGGQSIAGSPDLYKLNALTGATIWSAVSGNAERNPVSIARDNMDNVFLWRDVTLVKYNSAGALQWPITTPQLGNGIACDSEGNVYTCGSMSGDANLRKYNSEGVLQWAVRAEGDEANPSLNSIAITLNDDIFVVGQTTETPPGSGIYHTLYKWNTDGVLQASIGIGAAAAGKHGRHVCADKLGNVFVDSNEGYLEKFDSNLGSQFGNMDLWGGISMIFCDAQNRVHWLGTTSGGKYAHGIRNKDGGLDFGVNYNIGWAPAGAVACREVYFAHYTDQPTLRNTPDMSCFHDDTIPQFQEYGDPDEIDDVLWWDSLRSQGTDLGFEDRTGVFVCIAEVDPPKPESINDQDVYTQLSLTPPSQNVTWDQYTDKDGNPFGGIGGAPQIYTVSFYDMLKVSDDSPSEYNGEYLIIRGPGTYGFFFGVQHDNKTRINFWVHPESKTDTKEKLHFGTDDDPTSIFKFETSSNHDEKLTDVESTNTKTTSKAVAYGGFASMYPGRIERWDGITIWPVDAMVAWHGLFHKALNQNVNSEPPSADWTAA